MLKRISDIRINSYFRVTFGKWAMSKCDGQEDSKPIRLNSTKCRPIATVVPFRRLSCAISKNQCDVWHLTNRRRGVFLWKSHIWRGAAEMTSSEPRCRRKKAVRDRTFQNRNAGEAADFVARGHLKFERGSNCQRLQNL